MQDSRIKLDVSADGQIEVRHRASGVLMSRIESPDLIGDAILYALENVDDLDKWLEEQEYQQSYYYQQQYDYDSN